jgi:hypothetical protein
MNHLLFCGAVAVAMITAACQRLPQKSLSAKELEAVRTAWRSTLEPTLYTFTDAAGVELTRHGKYLGVYKKQADGSWKLAADMLHPARSATSIR